MNKLREQLPGTCSVLEDGIRRHLHLGAQIYVSRNGRVLADASVGESRPGTPMSSDRLLPWLSSAKPITAVAVAQLVEQGRFRLEDRVSLHIPEFAQGGKESITLRHLLTHTAGFRSADQLPHDLPWEEMVTRICAAPLEPGWIPGRKGGYQLFSSWFILGELVRRSAGEPFERYVRRRIFEPMEMTDCWIGMPREDFEQNQHRLAPLWNTFSGHPKPFADGMSDALHGNPGRGGYGPARGLGRFYEALLGVLAGSANVAEPILGPDSLTQLVSRQRVGLFDHTFHYALEIGLGFIPNPPMTGHAPPPYGYGPHASKAAFGHGGAQSSCAFADPENGVVAVWICNGRPGEPRHQRRAWAVNTAIYEDLRRA